MEMFFVLLVILGIWALGFAISYLLSMIFLGWLGYEDGRLKTCYALALSIPPNKWMLGWLKLALLGFIIWKRPESNKW